MKARSIFAAALLALAAGCASSSTERAATERATEDAERDLARGRPRLAIIGLVPDDASALDPATGRVRLSLGCCRTPERIAYCDAYNGVVGAATGLYAITLEKKATTRAAADAMLAGGDAQAIRLGGAAADAPGGRFRIDVSPGTGRDAIAIWCTDTSADRRDELRYLGSANARIAFSADGTTLFVRDDAARATSTYDLPSALFLQVFPDAPRER